MNQDDIKRIESNQRKWELNRKRWAEWKKNNPEKAASRSKSTKFNSLTKQESVIDYKYMKNIIENLVVGKYYQIENHIGVCELYNNKKQLQKITTIGIATHFYDEMPEVKMTPELLKQCEERKNGTMNFIGSFNESSKYKGD